MPFYEVKSINVYIDKSYEFNIKKSLNILALFINEFEFEECYFVFGNREWIKGYPKDKYSKKIKKSILSYLNQFDDDFKLYDSVYCDLKYKGEDVSISFSKMKDIHNSLMCYSVAFYDHRQVTDKNFDKKFIKFFIEKLGHEFITEIKF